MTVLSWNGGATRDGTDYLKFTMCIVIYSCSILAFGGYVNIKRIMEISHHITIMSLVCNREMEAWQTPQSQYIFNQDHFRRFIGFSNFNLIRK